MQICQLNDVAFNRDGETTLSSLGLIRMKHIFMLTLLDIVLLTTNAMTIYGKEYHAGPRIVHEEEEITVLANGKKSTFYVGKNSEQKSSITWSAYKNKNNVEVKVVENPKLKFYDAHGNVIKVIDLASEKGRGRMMETRQFHVKGEFDVELTTVKQPKVSRNEQYAAMNNTTYAQGSSMGYVVPIGKLILFDVTGNELFEKTYPYGQGIESERNIVLAENGTVAVVTTEEEEGPQAQYLYAYDKRGNALLEYPKEDVAIDGLVEVLKISPNGRYLAARVDFENKYIRTVFFDLKENKSWKADRNYVVHEISDSGFAEADYYDESKGEPNGMELIELGPRMMADDSISEPK